MTSTRAAPKRSAMAPAKGMASPHTRFCKAIANEKVSRPQPRSIEIGRRNRPKLCRVPRASPRMMPRQTSTTVGVRAGPPRGHAAALVAPEGPVDLEQPRRQRVRRNLVENLMRIERAVVAAYAGVVAAHQQMRAAVVLPEQRVQQSLARTCVAHVERIARLQ